MPLSTLDATVALIVVDLQKGFVGAMAPELLQPIVAQSAALAEAFRERGLPVVIVTADGLPPGRNERSEWKKAYPAGFADVMDELAPQATDIRLRKQTLGAFSGNDLAQSLESRGVTQVVITGVATSLGVESTARQAYAAGFNVVFATDAIADMDPRAHERSIELVFPWLGERGSATDVMALLKAY